METGQILMMQAPAAATVTGASATLSAGAQASAENAGKGGFAALVNSASSAAATVQDKSGSNNTLESKSSGAMKTGKPGEGTMPEPVKTAVKEEPRQEIDKLVLDAQLLASLLAGQTTTAEAVVLKTEEESSTEPVTRSNAVSSQMKAEQLSVPLSKTALQEETTASGLILPASGRSLQEPVKSDAPAKVAELSINQVKRSAADPEATPQSAVVAGEAPIPKAGTAPQTTDVGNGTSLLKVGTTLPPESNASLEVKSQEAPPAIQLEKEVESKSVASILPKASSEAPLTLQQSEPVYPEIQKTAAKPQAEVIPAATPLESAVKIVADMQQKQIPAATDTQMAAMPAEVKEVPEAPVVDAAEQTAVTQQKQNPAATDNKVATMPAEVKEVPDAPVMDAAEQTAVTQQKQNPADPEIQKRAPRTADPVTVNQQEPREAAVTENTPSTTADKAASGSGTILKSAIKESAPSGGDAASGNPGRGDGTTPHIQHQPVLKSTENAATTATSGASLSQPTSQALSEHVSKQLNETIASHEIKNGNDQITLPPHP